jgi:hypothetical protein
MYFIYYFLIMNIKILVSTSKKNFINKTVYNYSFIISQVKKLKQ